MNALLESEQKVIRDGFGFDDEKDAGRCWRGFWCHKGENKTDRGKSIKKTKSFVLHEETSRLFI